MAIEFEEIGFAFDEVGEEIGILRGQGAELGRVCLASSSWLSCKAWVAVYDSLQAARARRDEHGARRGAVPRRMLKIQSGYRKFTQERRQALLLVEYGFLKVRLPSHSDRIADITEGPSRATSGSP
jgi:hypothetical protein